MKKVLLGILGLLLAVTGCGSTTPQQTPPSPEQAAAAFMETLRNDYGYPVSGWEVDEESADKAKKKKGTAKATKTPASKAPANKPPASAKSSTTTPPPTTTTTSTAPKIYVLEVKFRERGCEWEAQKKLGDPNFKIDETTDRAGEEVGVDFEAENPTNAQFLAWVDLPNNRVKFDCYAPA